MSILLIVVGIVVWLVVGGVVVAFSATQEDVDEHEGAAFFMVITWPIWFVWCLVQCVMGAIWTLRRRMGGRE